MSFFERYLGKRGQAVGGAGSVGNHIHVGLVFLLVDSHHKGRSLVRGRGGDDDLRNSQIKSKQICTAKQRETHLLCSSLQMGRGLGSGREDSSGLHNVVGMSSSPSNVGRIWKKREKEEKRGMKQRFLGCYPSPKTRWWPVRWWRACRPFPPQFRWIGRAQSPAETSRPFRAATTTKKIKKNNKKWSKKWEKENQTTPWKQTFINGSLMATTLTWKEEGRKTFFFF